MIISILAQVVKITALLNKGQFIQCKNIGRSFWSTSKVTTVVALIAIASHSAFQVHHVTWLCITFTGIFHEIWPFELLAAPSAFEREVKCDYFCFKDRSIKLLPVDQHCKSHSYIFNVSPQKWILSSWFWWILGPAESFCWWTVR